MPAITRRRTINTLLATTASIAWLAVYSPAHGQSPQAPTVAAGSIAVTRQGATTVVSQATDRGIIDWRSFSIGAGEGVRFDQPGRSSVTLNRVTGSELSRIDGNLSANGQVWLANPNGVMIGPSGQVNVGGLLATTGRVDAAEFLKSGRASIDQIGKDASIANFGTVNIAEGGYAALAAASIRNEGVVAARKGSVALGAGKAVTLDFTGDKLITFQVTKPLDQAIPGDSMISVGGTLAAEGGTVLMSARAAKGVMDNVINLKGHVVASTVKVDGGTVSFGDGGIVQVSGKIDASNAAGKGGSVAVLGEKVGLMDGASIDASGASGGGTVLVGGDWQGKGPSHNATIAYVAPTASINVDATMAGDGGKAVVWADDTTRFNGTITARGGVLAGDGGQVETSGKRALHVAPTARATTKGRATASKAGTWLLDPTDIEIVSTGGAVVNLVGGSFTPAGASTTIDVGVINAALDGGDNVTLQTSGVGSGNGDITFTSGTITTSYSSGALTLKLLADRDIKIESGAAIKLEGEKHNIVLNSAVTAADQASVVGGILIDGATLTTTGGNISMVAGSKGDLYASASSVVVASAANGVFLRAGALIDAGAGSVHILGAAPSGLGSLYGQGVELANSTVKGEAGVTLKGIGSTDATDQSYGVFIWDVSEVKTKGGALVIEGTSSGTATASRGVAIDATLTVESGDVTITGTAGPGGVSRGVAVGTSTFNLGSGSVSITGTAGAGTDSAGGNYGVYFDASSPNTTSITGSGTITITGTGGGSSSNSGNDGVLLKRTDLSLTGNGVLKITGTRGVGSSSANIRLSSNTNLTTELGAITLDGSSTTGDGSDTVGVGQESGSKIKTQDGAITITGSAASSGTSNSDGVSLDYVEATGIGSITVTATRGPGSQSEGFLTYGGTFKTVSGDISISATSASGSGSDLVGVLIFGPSEITTTSGKITLDGVGASSGTGDSSGVKIDDGSKLTATGSGDILLKGVAGGGSGVGLNIASGTISVYSGVATLQTNSLSFGSSSEVTTTNSGSINVRGYADSNSIRVGGGAGDLQITSSMLNYLNADLVIGSATQTGDIIVADGTILQQNTSFRSDNGAISFAGSVGGNSGLYSLTIENASGTTSFGGAVGGGGSPFTSINVSGALRVSGDVTTSGTQSYGGAVVLAASATFTTVETNVTFAGPLDSLDGTQSLSVNLAGATLSLTGGVGQTTPLATLLISDPVALGGLITTAGSQSYGGSVTIVSDTTLDASELRFNGDVSGSNNLNITAGSVELGGANISLNAGTLSFSGGVYLTNDVTISAGATIFYGSVATLSDDPERSLTISSGDLTLFQGTGSGSLSYLSVTSGATTLSGTVTTTGDQNYGGTLILSDHVTLTSASGSLTFGGAISGSGQDLSVFTSGVNITLPSVTVDNLTVTTGGGAVTQSAGSTVTVTNLSITTGGGAVTQGAGSSVKVTNNAFIDAGSAAVSLDQSTNSIAELALTAGDATVTVSGDMKLSDTSVTSLTLTTTGTVTQSGALTASSLSLNGSGGVYELTDSSNNIGSLTADTSKVTVTNSDANSLQIGSAGVTVDSGLNLTQSGSGQTITLNGLISLGSSTATLTVDGSIAGGTVSGTGATLNLDVSANGGSINTSGTVTINVTNGEITVDGVLKSPTPVSTLPVSTTTTATTSTVTTTTNPPTVTSDPTVATVASQPSQASQASQASTPSVSSSQTVEKTVEADTAPTLIGNESVVDVVGRLIVSIEGTTPNLNNSLSSTLQDDGGLAGVQTQSQSVGQSPVGATGNSGSDTDFAAFTAQRQLSLVNAAAVGALIPPTPTVVPSTGAPLVAANTIKVDPADTGGANGQVIARAGTDGAVGVGVSGVSSQARGFTTVLPGLLVQAPRPAPPQGEPPLAEQPSTINEEVFLD